MSQILIFGSSTVQGFWDKDGGWADRIKKYILQSLLPHPEREIHVFNLGISGQTSEDIINRFDAETKQRIRHPKTLFIFSFGGNDSQFLGDKQSVRTAPNIFINNVTTILKKAKAHSSLIVFVGLQPINEFKTNPIPWEKNISFKNNLIKKYNDIEKDICKNEKIDFIDIYTEWLKTDYLQFVSEDGLHPNSKGHEIIFEQVKNYLVSRNIISSM